MWHEIDLMTLILEHLSVNRVPVKVCNISCQNVANSKSSQKIAIIDNYTRISKRHSYQNMKIDNNVNMSKIAIIAKVARVF